MSLCLSFDACVRFCSGRNKTEVVIMAKANSFHLHTFAKIANKTD